MRQVIVVAISVILVLGISQFGFAQDLQGISSSEEAGAEQVASNVENKVQGLGLTQEQKDKLKSIRSQYQQKIKGLRETLKSKMSEFRQEIEKNTSDNAKIESLISEVGTLKSNTLRAISDKIAAMKAILTPEQFQKLSEKMGDLKEKGKQKIGKIRSNMKK